MNHVLDIPVEVQKETLWCWAAVSTMAVKTFSDDPELKKITQLKTVAYALNEVRTTLELAAKKADVKATQKHCKTLGNCNLPGNSMVVRGCL